MDDLNLNGSVRLEDFLLLSPTIRRRLVQEYKLLNPLSASESKLTKELLGNISGQNN